MDNKFAYNSWSRDAFFHYFCSTLCAYPCSLCLSDATQWMSNYYLAWCRKDSPGKGFTWLSLVDLMEKVIAGLWWHLFLLTVFFSQHQNFAHTSGHLCTGLTAPWNDSMQGSVPWVWDDAAWQNYERCCHLSSLLGVSAAQEILCFASKHMLPNKDWQLKVLSKKSSKS